MWDASDLELLRVLRGRLYKVHRDRVLAANVSFDEVLVRARAQPDKRLELTAMFLAGWARDRDKYEAFASRLDGIDVKGVSSTVKGLGGVIDAVAYDGIAAHGEALLPYCWERLVKLSDVPPAWQLGACLEMIRQTASESSIEPLLWCVDEATSASLIDAVHQVLQALPFQGWKDRFTEGMSPHTMRRYVYEDMLLRIKLAGTKKKKG